MPGILRGEVRWANLNPVRGHKQGGTRPIIILSRDVFNERSGTVIAMAITSQPQRAGFPLALELESSSLPKRSWIRISQVRTLSVARIGNLIETLPPEEFSNLVDGLNEIIG